MTTDILEHSISEDTYWSYYDRKALLVKNALNKKNQQLQELGTYLYFTTAPVQRMSDKYSNKCRKEFLDGTIYSVEKVTCYRYSDKALVARDIIGEIVFDSRHFAALNDRYSWFFVKVQ